MVKLLIWHSLNVTSVHEDHEVGRLRVMKFLFSLAVFSFEINRQLPRLLKDNTLATSQCTIMDSALPGRSQFCI
jgi:hypothetical protein